MELSKVTLWNGNEIGLDNCLDCNKVLVEEYVVCNACSLKAKPRPQELSEFIKEHL